MVEDHNRHQTLDNEILNGMHGSGVLLPTTVNLSLLTLTSRTPRSSENELPYAKSTPRRDSEPLVEHFRE